MDTDKIIPNTWQKECEAWLDKLYKKRREFFENHKLGDPIDKELFYRNWGDINYYFSIYFFELLEKIKDNKSLYQEYIEQANSIILRYDLETDLSLIKRLSKNIDKELIT